MLSTLLFSGNRKRLTKIKSIIRLDFLRLLDGWLININWIGYLSQFIWLSFKILLSLKFCSCFICIELFLLPEKKSLIYIKYVFIGREKYKTKQFHSWSTLSCRLIPGSCGSFTPRIYIFLYPLPGTNSF